MEECTDIFENLGKIASNLHFGSLQTKGSEDVNGYPIFESLVRVFEHIVVILVFSCDFMVKAEKVMRNNPGKLLNGKRSKIRLRASLSRIVSRAHRDLEQARVDIILASKTNNRPGDVALASIGPEFVIAMISSRLSLRQLPNNSTPIDRATGGDNTETRSVDVGEVYKTCADQLQLQVNQKPKKLLLPDIYALEEELDILLRLNAWQRKFCHDLFSVLDPSSYRITTKARISYFRIEGYHLSKTIRRLEARRNELCGLQRRAEKLRDQLQQSIEIEEESHGKAIRVFTFVTLFFLPL